MSSDCTGSAFKSNAKEIDSLRFKLWYSSMSHIRNCVGVIIDKSLKDNFVTINKIRERIIALKIVSKIQRKIPSQNQCNFREKNTVAKSVTN
ncbi:hypothetical protein IEQ34_008647 [Dendrobium chrysotoxum]|uniref:Uncharacterized protein n=1 Tax=Dendrobium chrysotoxum TaxID=161865 RepID=A0AAV7GZX7_DENCH|nr:hypothetical protein IEQ34_008647 [Dendrobium chrysotoxum]